VYKQFIFSFWINNLTGTLRFLRFELMFIFVCIYAFFNQKKIENRKSKIKNQNLYCVAGGFISNEGQHKRN
jgi:hypothetical protein